MAIAALILDARRLWAGETPPAMPLAFVELDDTSEWPGELALPPFPVIGLGPRDHPLAPALDAVIEPPVTAEGLAAQVTARPRAAAVLVELLRLLPALGAQDGLTAELLAYGLLQGGDEHRRWLARQTLRPVEPAGNVRVIREGEELLVVLDRPASGNAIDRPMRDALHQAFALAALDPAIARIVLRGMGRSFSLGADLAEFGTTRDPAEAHAIRARSLPARELARCAEKLTVHVAGACVGAGLEMAAWGQRLTATAGAWFQLPELAMGLLPGAGGCVSLSRRIGRQRTALLVLSGRRIAARTALAWGLVDAIVNQVSGDDRRADIV